VSAELSRRVLVLALAGLAAGCATTPPADLFTLVSRPGDKIDRSVRSVAVRVVDVAKYLDRPQIVRRNNAYEVTAAEFERWAEALDTMATRVLVENLSLRLPGSQVSAAASPVTVRADVVVAVDIARFDPDPDGTVILVARWTARHGDTPAPVQLERITAATGSKSVTDLVGAMSDCLGQLSDRIAASLATA
jgi:uncharacterized protein